MYPGSLQNSIKKRLAALGNKRASVSTGLVWTVHTEQCYNNENIVQLNELKGQRVVWLLISISNLALILSSHFSTTGL